jgi:hypothetical protein
MDPSLQLGFAIFAAIAATVSIVANLIKVYEFADPRLKKLHEWFLTNMATDWPYKPWASFFYLK